MISYHPSNTPTPPPPRPPTRKRLTLPTPGRPSGGPNPPTIRVVERREIGWQGQHQSHPPHPHPCTEAKRRRLHAYTHCRGRHHPLPFRPPCTEARTNAHHAHSTLPTTTTATTATGAAASHPQTPTSTTSVDTHMENTPHGWHASSFIHRSGASKDPTRDLQRTGAQLAGNAIANQNCEFEGSTRHSSAKRNDSWAPARPFVHHARKAC